MAEVRGDSVIQIRKGDIKTCIMEQDYESTYKPEGWKVVTKDWTQERTVKPRVDVTEHMAIGAMAQGSYKKK